MQLAGVLRLSPWISQTPETKNQ